jgi:hypothetical protein
MNEEWRLVTSSLSRRRRLRQLSLSRAQQGGASVLSVHTIRRACSSSGLPTACSTSGQLSNQQYSPFQMLMIRETVHEML